MIIARSTVRKYVPAMTNTLYSWWLLSACLIASAGVIKIKPSKTMFKTVKMVLYKMLKNSLAFMLVHGLHQAGIAVTDLKASILLRARILEYRARLEMF